MNPNQFKNWLADDEPLLIEAVVGDAERNIQEIQSQGNTIFGYSILPPDYYTQPDPSTIYVAYNLDESILVAGDTAERTGYIVNEWQNMVHDGFDAANLELNKILTKFRKNHSKPEPEIVFDEHGQVTLESLERFITDDLENLYVSKVNRSILAAMMRLKESGVFNSDPFLEVFVFESSCEIVNTSAKLLNSSAHYANYLRAMGR